MNKFKILMVSLAVFVVICGLAPAAAQADDQQTIADLEHKWVVATDPDEVMKYFESGNDVVLFDVMTPREFIGHKAIHDHFAEFSGNKDVKVDFLELQVITDGKLALARSVQRLTGKGADGKPFDATYRMTDVWRNTDGQWKMIVSHASFPVDMKTGKADMQSKM